MKIPIHDHTGTGNMTGEHIRSLLAAHWEEEAAALDPPRKWGWILLVLLTLGLALRWRKHAD